MAKPNSFRERNASFLARLYGGSRLRNFGGGKLKGGQSGLTLQIEHMARFRSPKIHARASARFEKSFFTTGPPVNRLPRRTRQNFRPRPLVVFATPTPEGKSLIRALKRAKFIRQLSAHVNNRVKCQTVNPLAYAFRGSNPLLPIALKPACIKDLRFFAFWKRFSIVQYRTDRIRPKSVHRSLQISQSQTPNFGALQNGGTWPSQRDAKSGAHT
jgi:hypothetical protein